MKKEAAIMAKEIEKRQKEYIEKQKIKHKMENKCKLLFCSVFFSFVFFNEVRSWK